MQRRIDTEDRIGLWIERIVWNVAAGAVLAAMVLALLGMLQWLDEVAPHAEPAWHARPLAQEAEPLPPPVAAARVERPSG